MKVVILAGGLGTRIGEETVVRPKPMIEIGGKWRVTLVDTGEGTQTGGRPKRVRDYVGDEDFCFTCGDGLGDVDIGKPPWKVWE